MILQTSLTNNDIANVTYQQWYCKHHLPTMILQTSLTNNDIADITFANVTYQQWYCKHHLPTMILQTSLTNNDIANITYQQWYCRHHLPTMILQTSLTNNDIADITYQQWYCKHHLPTMILQTSLTNNDTANVTYQQWYCGLEMQGKRETGGCHCWQDAVVFASSGPDQTLGHMLGSMMSHLQHNTDNQIRHLVTRLDQRCHICNITQTTRSDTWSHVWINDVTSAT